jgi:hypothetical protein
MKAKSVMYAAVGAPVVVARKMGERVSSLKGNLDKQTSAYTKKAEARIEAWANEGEKVVSRIGDGKVVEEISSKVDLDQAKEQVTKLRDQLEDMLDTWKASFRPEKETANKTAAAAKPAAKSTVTTSTATKKPAAKKPAAKKPASKKPAAKTSAAKIGTKTSAAKTTKSTTAKTSPKKATAGSTAKAS